MRIIRYTFLVFGLMFFTQCGEDEPTPVGDSFDRKEVIERIADELILPSYSDLNVELLDFKAAFDIQKSNPSEINLSALKAAWLEAYLAWQEAALWDFGPATDEGLISSMNIYPTDTVQIANNLTSGSYDLNSIAQFDAQGFPALEYLLYSHSTDWNNSSVTQYFEDVLNRMIAKSSNTAQAWSASYRTSFVNAEGTDRGSALGQLFNATFLPYLEVHQREAKFGIPGGQRTGQPAPDKVEGLYSKTHSRELASKAFSAYRRSWLGMSHEGHLSGPSVMDYVVFMDQRNGTELASKLQNQLETIQLAIDGLDNDFYSIAQTNPQQLNDVWIKYQLMVFTIKTEVSSSLNVTISYVDSDGD